MSDEDINEELIQIVRDMRDAQVKTADNVESIARAIQKDDPSKPLDFGD